MDNTSSVIEENEGLFSRFIGSSTFNKIFWSTVFYILVFVYKPFLPPMDSELKKLKWEYSIYRATLVERAENGPHSLYAIRMQEIGDQNNRVNDLLYQAWEERSEGKRLSLYEKIFD